MIRPVAVHFTDRRDQVVKIRFHPFEFHINFGAASSSRIGAFGANASLMALLPAFSFVAKEIGWHYMFPFQTLGPFLVLSSFVATTPVVDASSGACAVSRVLASTVKRFSVVSVDRVARDFLGSAESRNRICRRFGVYAFALPWPEREKQYSHNECQAF